jgi:hypothetical protein
MPDAKTRIVDGGRQGSVPANGSDEDRLERIERMLQQLLDRSSVKSHYAVEEFGVLVKRAPFTVRQWCNEGRIKAEKSMTRSGSCSRWVISHEEYERFQREGLLPPYHNRLNHD